MPRATMTIDTRVPARRSGYERVSVDIVQDDAAFGLKRAIFTSERKLLREGLMMMIDLLITES